MTRALIVDDRPDNLYLLRSILQAHGWQVDQAADGADALAQARQRRPDIVVTDLLMPVMDGYTLLRHWRADPALRGVPVVVYTATYTAPEDEQLALSLGAVAFVVKPQEPADLVVLLDGVLGRRIAPPAAVPPAPGEERLRQYSEVLVRKLEHKTAQLEEANRRLEGDLAARVRAEAMAEASEQRLRLALEAAHMGTFEWDVAADRIMWSPGHEQLWGFQLPAAGGSYASYAARVHPQDLAAADAQVRRCMAAREPFNHECRLVWPDDTVHWIQIRGDFEFDAGGAPLRMRGVVMEVTARKVAEERLRKSEADLRLAQARANIGSWELDLSQGTVACSDEMWRLIGRDQPVLPLALAELAAALDPADRWAVQPGGVWSLQEPRAGRQQVRLRHADGTVTWIECRAETELDPAGQPVRVRGTAQDVTERQFLVGQLADSNEQLRALAARMDRLREEESSRLSRELHDELGQALAGLKLDLATLHARLPAGETGLAGRVRAMQAQIDEMVRTTRDIARRLRPRVLDDLGLLPAIEAQAAEICRRMGARFEIVSDVDNEALADPALATAVFRVVQEALTNIARHAGATRVDISVQRQPGWLVVEVRDNGKGMVDPQPPGRATLGLLGMHERAAAIGGEVTVEGFPGRGTVVTLRAPMPRHMEAA